MDASHIYFDLLSLSLNKNYNGWRRHRCFTLIWLQHIYRNHNITPEKRDSCWNKYVCTRTSTRTYKVHVHVWTMLCYAMPYHTMPCYYAMLWLHSIAIMAIVAMPFNSTGCDTMLCESVCDSVFYFSVVWIFFG